MGCQVRTTSVSMLCHALAASRLRGLFSGPTFAAILFTLTVYLFWNLAAGTLGVFRRKGRPSSRSGQESMSSSGAYGEEDRLDVIACACDFCY